jgi:hypothetical protein
MRIAECGLARGGAEARRCGEGYHEWEGTSSEVGERVLRGWRFVELVEPDPGWPQIGGQIDLAFDRADEVLKGCYSGRILRADRISGGG